jgi:hypothetical protein
VVCDIGSVRLISTSAPGTALPCESSTVTSMRPWNSVCARWTPATCECDDEYGELSAHAYPPMADESQQAKYQKVAVVSRDERECAAL